MLWNGSVSNVYFDISEHLSEFLTVLLSPNSVNITQMFSVQRAEMSANISSVYIYWQSGIKSSRDFLSE